MIILKDGRFASGAWDNSIIIYNKVNYKPDLVIKEHNNFISCLIQLTSGIIASCSGDKTIKLFEVIGNKYVIKQTLTYHTDYVNRIIELNNKDLASCSHDYSIFLYKKDNSEYIINYQIATKGVCFFIIQTKENEICYSEFEKKFITICFFDLNERKIISKINNIRHFDSCRFSIEKIGKDLLLIPGENNIYIININKYELIRKIDSLNSGWIKGICKMNQNILLTGDSKSTIKEWIIEGDNLILISKKENVQNSSINVLLNIGNGLIASGSEDSTIKILK